MYSLSYAMAFITCFKCFGKCLVNRKTDWDAFRHLLNERLLLNVHLETDSDIEAAIKNFNDIIVAGPQPQSTLKPAGL
jgi:hypothetical protein